MASVDVGVGLLGYGTVGTAVNRLLTDSVEEIERATGHRLRVASFGVTLSGAGPSVVVWARKEERDACVAELEKRLPQAHVWPLEVAQTGAEETR